MAVVLPGTKPAGAKTPICWGKLRGGDDFPLAGAQFLHKGKPFFRGILNCALNGPFIFADWALHIFCFLYYSIKLFFQIKDPKRLSTLPEANGGWTTNFLLGLPFFREYLGFRAGIYIYIFSPHPRDIHLTHWLIAATAATSWLADSCIRTTPTANADRPIRKTRWPCLSKRRTCVWRYHKQQKMMLGNVGEGGFRSQNWEVGGR